MTARTRRVDLNADVGEAADEAGVATERALLGLVTSAHVACGGHAGDDISMATTVAAALEHGVRIGAHPGYPDREGYGRRRIDIDWDDLRSSLSGQLRSFERVCREAGTAFRSVKAHGALYEEVAKGGAAYESLRDAVREVAGPDAELVLPSGCRAMAMTVRDGVPASEEGFCDRAYRRDGGLLDRGAEGALIADPGHAASQAVGLARGAAVAADGCILTLWVDTLCVHGDSPGALAIAAAVRAALESSGIEVAAPAPA